MPTEKITYPLAASTWDDEEQKAVDSVFASGRLTMGERVREFEQAFAQHFGVKHAVMVNSGSSANLLAVAALIHSDCALSPGDEVIVPAVSWATTYFPWSQYGIHLRFVDIDPATLNIDPKAVEAAITEKTRAVCAVNLLGAPCAFDRLVPLCDEHDLILIEDNCESMGATFHGKACGTIGAIGTFSTFFSHHICTIEGGVAVTDDPQLYERMLSLRAHGWTRDLPDCNGIENKKGDPFHDSFRFVLPGYNLRPSELNAALGSVQLKKFDQFLAVRRDNAEYFRLQMASIPEVGIQEGTAESSWFGFAMQVGDRRECVVEAFRDAGIETRPVVAGNFARQPVVKHLPHTIAGSLTHADAVDRGGLFVGNHHFDLKPQIDLLRRTLGGLYDC